MTASPVAWEAVAAVATAELRRRWRSLLALGLLAGLTGATVLGALACGRRTATAYDRLAAASHIDDARVLTLGSVVPDAALGSLPGVGQRRAGVFGVAKLARPGVVYIGVQSLAPEPSNLFTPVVVEGRMFRSDAPDEAVLVEGAAVGLGIAVGDVLRLQMLTAEQVQQFATGFGEPDGPTVDVRIAGLARTPGPVPDPSPLLVSPAFVIRHPDALAAGRISYLRLNEGEGSLAKVREELNRLSESVSASEQTVLLPQLLRPTESEPTVRATTRVLSGGLFVFAALIGLVGMVSVVLAFVRYQARGAADQRIEAALGLTPAERTGARALAALLTAAVAAVIAGAGALTVAGLDPLGGLRNLEPHPGWSPNLVVILPGVLLTGLTALGLAALTARVARREPAPGGAPAHTLRLPGPAWLTTGVRFAVETGAGRRRVPVRSSLAGVVLGVLGLVGTTTFAASRDALVSTPSLWGAPEHFSVVDVTPPIVSRLVADPRVEAVSTLRAGVVRFQDRDVSGYALIPSKGSLGWTILSGRMPSGPDEVTVGTRLARRLGLDVGDRVTAEDSAGQAHGFNVVGIGLGQSVYRERLGDNVLLSAQGLERVQRAQPDHQALVRVDRTVDRSAFRRELAAEYEVVDPEQPSEVRNLVELGRLPQALGACLAVIAAAALGHALVTTVQRRAWDLAVLRVMGLTSAQAGACLLAMALTTAVLGTACGTLLGLAGGRLAWSAMMQAFGLSATAEIPLPEVASITLAIVMASILIAAAPARRASRVVPAAVLRQE